MAHSDIPKPKKHKVCEAELTLESHMPKLPISELPEFKPKVERFEDIDSRLTAMQMKIRTP